MTGTERKVFQKYYPPDFDPSKIPRAKGPRNRQFVQRVMAPCNMQCNTCREYIYKGKKFNMKRETAEGELYLGLKIFRFYFKCPNCLADISFKTDLENCDYQMEHGATRLFEAFKLYQKEEKRREAQEEEDAKDPMKMLEKRTEMSRQEMEAMGDLEEIQELNRQHQAVDIDKFILEESAKMKMTLAEKLVKQEEEDEADIRGMYGVDDDGKIRRRIDDEETEEQKQSRLSLLLGKFGEEKPDLRDVKAEIKPAIGKRLADQKSLLKGIVVKKKKVDVNVKKEEPEEDLGEGSSSSGGSSGAAASFSAAGAAASSSNSTASASGPSKPPAGLAGLVAYGSDSDESE